MLRDLHAMMMEWGWQYAMAVAIPGYSAQDRWAAQYNMALRCIYALEGILRDEDNIAT
jgi:hypothetical protein